MENLKLFLFKTKYLLKPRDICFRYLVDELKLMFNFHSPYYPFCNFIPISVAKYELITSITMLDFEILSIGMDKGSERYTMYIVHTYSAPLYNQ